MLSALVSTVLLHGRFQQLLLHSASYSCGMHPVVGLVWCSAPKQPHPVQMGNQDLALIRRRMKALSQLNQEVVITVNLFSAAIPAMKCAILHASSLPLSL